jgi:hypothetical protein
MKCRAVAPGHQGHRPAALIRLAGAFFIQMAGDAQHILHERHRVLEDVVVDALKNIADGRARLAKRDAIGVIDVPVPVRLGRQKFSGNAKIPGHSANIVFGFHCQSFSG